MALKREGDLLPHDSVVLLEEAEKATEDLDVVEGRREFIGGVSREAVVTRVRNMLRTLNEFLELGAAVNRSLFVTVAVAAVRDAVTLKGDD